MIALKMVHSGGVAPNNEEFGEVRPNLRTPVRTWGSTWLELRPKERARSFWVAQRFQRCDSGTHTDRLQPLRETVKFFDIPDPPIIEARLPDFTAKAQFLRGSEREAAFDQLQGSL